MEQNENDPEITFEKYMKHLHTAQLNSYLKTTGRLPEDYEVKDFCADEISLNSSSVSKMNIVVKIGKAKPRVDYQWPLVEDGIVTIGNEEDGKE